MRTPLGFLALVAFLSITTSASTAEEYRTRSMRFVPTQLNFATPHAPLTLRPTVVGNLVCTSNAANDCMVANMPLLSQVDPRLKAPLVAYALRYVVTTGPNRGKVIWSEPQFGIGPTPYSAVEFAQSIMNYGCYITSLTSLEVAAAANQPHSPTGRALTFSQIGANTLVTGDAAVNRLEWQYRRWADKLQPNLAHPNQPSSPDFLEIQEFAHDYPAGAMTFQDISNAASVSSNAMIAGMRAGTMYLIAFQRDRVAIAPSADGRVHLSLAENSHHKVAVSGFQPGAYPLLINDVGNGQRYRIRVTTDPRSISFSTSVNGQTEAIPANQIEVDPPGARLYLVYEGAEGVNITNGGQVFVIEDIQALTVPTGRAMAPPTVLTRAPIQVRPTPPITPPVIRPRPSGKRHPLRPTRMTDRRNPRLAESLDSSRRSCCAS